MRKPNPAKHKTHQTLDSMVHSSDGILVMPLFCRRERVNREKDLEEPGLECRRKQDSRKSFLGIYWLGEVRWGRRSSGVEDAAA